MKRAEWYVIQVMSGREQHACLLIQDACKNVCDSKGEPLLREVFNPRYRTRRKYRGEWRDVERDLLPGYVIAVTEDPDAVRELLRQVPALTKVLMFGSVFVPLREDERSWLEQSTSRGDRVVPMSVAVKDGDKVIVTKGPLKGREAFITRINRHKCMASLELHVGGVRITTRVGLAVLAQE